MPSMAKYERLERFMKKVTKVLYGSVGIFRGYCEDCEMEALVIDGYFKCCGEEAEKSNTYNVKRESVGPNTRRISRKIKTSVLIEQQYKCIYCDCDLTEYQQDQKRGGYQRDKIHFDHFVPWSYSRDNNEGNIVATCPACNLCKSDLLFDTIEDAQAWILMKRFG